MNAWWKFSKDLTAAGFEAGQVVALRLAKLAAGGSAADREARRMFVEKVVAATEASALFAGGHSPQKVLKLYRSKMRANARRLMRSQR